MSRIGWRARVRRYGWLTAAALLSIVWLRSASRPGTRAEGCPELCATAGERRDGPLRVMSLNVLHDFPRFERLSERLDRIVAEIRRQDADIVCLQEVPWTPRLGNAARVLAERAGLNHLYLRANGNRWAILFEEGEAILSRYALQDVGFKELDPQTWAFENRVALRATAATPRGDVRVYVTHLTHDDPEVNRAQTASLTAFVSAVDGTPVIVAGDFNAVEGSPQIESIQWLDSYRTAHPDDDGHTCCIDDLSAGPGERLEARIDYIFVTGRAKVATSQRVLDRPFRTLEGWLWASDHVGLLTAISLD